MVYRVDITSPAKRTLRRVSPQAAARLAHTIRSLADDPRPHGTKALTGRWAGHYRLRVSAPGGDYRLIWTVDDDRQLVEVTYAGSREGAPYA